MYKMNHLVYLCSSSDELVLINLLLFLFFQFKTRARCIKIDVEQQKSHQLGPALEQYQSSHMEIDVQSSWNPRHTQKKREELISTLRKMSQLFCWSRSSRSSLMSVSFFSAVA